MPHLTIEYSANVADSIEIADIVQAAHHSAIETGLFNPDAVKTRAYACADFVLGTGKIDSFIHITIKIMPGRTEEQKKLLTNSVFNAVNLITANVGGLSVETTDLHRESYCKK